MIKLLIKIFVSLLAGIGLYALVTRLLNKYYENLAEETYEFDTEDSYEDDLDYDVENLEESSEEIK